jgi:putative ABC transport system permease protein
LLVRSFERLTSADIGFDPHNVYTTHIALPAARYTDAARTRRFIDEGIARLKDLHGVTDAAAVDYLPFGQSDLHIGMTIEGQESTPAGDVAAHYRAIAGDYLPAMRIPLLRGRAFEQTDGPTAPPVALVSEEMARRYWPNENPIGHRIRLGSATDSQPSPWMTIIGVVGNVKHWSFADAPEPMLYASLEQQPARSFSFVARLESERAATIAAVRDVLFTVDPQQPVTWQPLRALLDSAVAEPRFRSVFTAAFAILALALAIVGLYGLISFGVAQRTRELGVRVALGARHGDIVGLVVGEGMRLAILGIALGIAGALAATRLLRGMLYQVSATDMVTFVTVAGVLLTTAAIANYLPARRAARTDPVAALQSE